MRHIKQEFDKLSLKEIILYALAVASAVAAFVLLFLGMFIPPEGEIHDSVLMAYGVSLCFVTTLLGVSMHYANELTKFKQKAFNIIRETGKEAGGGENERDSQG